MQSSTVIIRRHLLRARLFLIHVYIRGICIQVKAVSLYYCSLTSCACCLRRTCMTARGSYRMQCKYPIRQGGGGTVVHPTQAHAVHAPARALLHGARVQCVRARMAGSWRRSWPSPAAKRTCSLRFQSPLSTRLEWNEMKCI